MLAVFAKAGAAVAKMLPKIKGGIEKGAQFLDKAKNVGQKVGSAIGDMSNSIPSQYAGNNQNTTSGSVTQNATGLAQYLPIVAIAAIAFLVLKK
jgi:hypothetical protein